MEDLAAGSGAERMLFRESQPDSGYPLELEWLRDLDADLARQVLMNFAGLSVGSRGPFSLLRCHLNIITVGARHCTITCKNIV